MTHPNSEAHEFLAARFRSLPEGERIEIRPIKAGVGPRRWHATPVAAADQALALARPRNVYYGVNPRRPGGGRTQDVTRVPALWADVDDKCFLDGHAGALAALAAFPYRPTWLVDSGGGCRLTGISPSRCRSPARTTRAASAGCSGGSTRGWGASTPCRTWRASCACRGPATTSVTRRVR